MKNVLICLKNVYLVLRSRRKFFITHKKNKKVEVNFGILGTFSYKSLKYLSEYRCRARYIYFEDT